MFRAVRKKTTRHTPRPARTRHPRLIEKLIRERIAFADVIIERQDDIRRLLSSYETHETIEHELHSSIDALRGIRKELDVIPHPATDLTISAFFPLNLPLYSLVLYGIIPSVFCQKVYARPPEVMHGILEELSRILELDKRFPVAITPLPRQIFVDLYARDSDVIVFTGKYENGLAVHAACPQALMIYEGSGVCPFVIFENADLKLATDKAIAMRCFNSGQDCVAPDAFFVPRAAADDFTALLIKKLRLLKIGDTTDPAVRIGRIIKTSYIAQLEQWLAEEQMSIAFGGEIDVKHNYIYPTVIQKPLAEHDGSFHEFFAPVFYVLVYDDPAELDRIWQMQDFVEHGMYVSVFGSNPAVEHKLTFAKILKETIVNDIEDGNEEYGGYGSKANCLLYGNEKLVQPVLISRDIQRARQLRV